MSGLFGWVVGLLSGRLPWEPEPGTHDAGLREEKLGARLKKESSKPPGQRDDELVHRLRLEYRHVQLENEEANAQRYAQLAAMFEQPADHECCAGAGWARQRMAASYRAQHDYVSQYIQQLNEEYAAAQARRQAALVAQPTLRLNLPEALQHPPPRLDLCSECAGKIEQVELTELGCRVHAEHLRQNYQQRGLQPATVAARPGLAEAPPAGETSQAGQQQQQQQQQQHSGGSDGKEEPATPTQQQEEQQAQQRTSEEEQQPQPQQPASVEEQEPEQEQEQHE